MQHGLGFCLQKQNTPRYLQEGLTWQSEQQQKETIEAFQVVFCLPKSTSYMHIHVHISPSHTYWAVRITSRVPRGCQNRSAKPFLTSQALPKALCNFCSDFTLLMNIFPMSESLTWEYKVGVQERYESLLSQRRQSKLVGQQNPALPHWRCI